MLCRCTARLLALQQRQGQQQTAAAAGAQLLQLRFMNVHEYQVGVLGSAQQPLAATAERGRAATTPATTNRRSDKSAVYVLGPSSCGVSSILQPPCNHPATTTPGC
jgi:hypothetical protein